MRLKKYTKQIMFLDLDRSLISPKLCLTENEFTKFLPE